MHTKLNKYVAKILILNDVTTPYIGNAIPYILTCKDKYDHLSISYNKNKNHSNITMDNRFAFITNYLSNIVKNKSKIPIEILVKIIIGSLLYLCNSIKIMLFYSTV